MQSSLTYWNKNEIENILHELQIPNELIEELHSYYSIDLIVDGDLFINLSLLFYDFYSSYLHLVEPLKFF